MEHSKELQKYIREYRLETLLPQSVLNQAVLLKYQRGQSVLSSGETLEMLYFFLSGKLKIFTIMENGKALLLRFYSSFNTLGEVELFRDTAITCHVEAAWDSVILGFPVECIRQYALEYPPFLKFIVVKLAEKLSDISVNSAANLTYPLINRLSSYLVEHLSDEAHQSEIVLQESQTEIAEYLGTSYRHLRRTYQELETQGLIHCDGRKIVILNRLKLKDLGKNLYLKANKS